MMQTKNFKGQDLRGKSFKNQDLTGEYKMNIIEHRLTIFHQLEELFKE